MKKYIPKILIVIGCYLLGVIIDVAVNGTDNVAGALIGMYGLFGFFAGIILVLLYPVKTNDKPKTGQGKTKSGEVMSQYYDARFISEKELLTESKFMPNTFRSLPLLKNSGIVIRNLVKGGKLQVNMYKPIHTLVIGTTGSGKTTYVIDPAIRILSHCGDKPCLVITDPKGELYTKHSYQLKKEGYRIMVLDLRNPYSSTRWNPMANAYVQYHRAKKLEKEVKVHNGGKPELFHLQKASASFEQIWYEFDGKAYATKEQMLNDLNVKRQQIIDQAENELREIAVNVVPIENKSEPSWEQGAQDFLYGLMLAMLEDSQDPRLDLTLDKFNFYNLQKIATFRDDDPDNPYATIRNYCGGRDRLSKVNSLTSTLINNAPTTMRSYMGILLSKIAIFQDGGICYATSYSDMMFDDFVDQPTALFIKVPDEKESRHCIATMCISQLYKKLIEIASNCPNIELPRTVYFLLDEFANLPKIEKMDSIITVARSRKIFFELVVQSYSQLDNKYGHDVAETIRGNCNIQIYLGTEDSKTKEDFSKMCGETSLEIENTSVSEADKKDGGKSKTKSLQTVTRPLIGPYELGQLQMGNAIVKIFQQHPIKTELTPYFDTPEFDLTKAPDEYVQAKPFDEDAIFYDIKKRNSIIFKPKRPSFDDFDF